ncbi:hypothetical protein SPI_00377 [Niveomyces insectorum RCEF 264]|uniref:Uncharacterized protein n=1 Tax=Niveomyces insectorum RCEF 264 TaxID=1081102 RepID=A0A162JFJ5_9HYPO|nr:hypothetical protein SPI_00377 [Niveomyces insectorum RCEF 264]
MLSGMGSLNFMYVAGLALTIAGTACGVYLLCFHTSTTFFAVKKRSAAQTDDRTRTAEAVLLARPSLKPSSSDEASSGNKARFDNEAETTDQQTETAALTKEKLGPVANKARINPSKDVSTIDSRKTKPHDALQPDSERHEAHEVLCVDGTRNSKLPSDILLATRHNNPSVSASSKHPSSSRPATDGLLKPQLLCVTSTTFNGTNSDHFKQRKRNIISGLKQTRNRIIKLSPSSVRRQQISHNREFTTTHRPRSRPCVSLTKTDKNVARSVYLKYNKRSAFTSLEEAAETKEAIVDHGTSFGQPVDSQNLERNGVPEKKNLAATVTNPINDGYSEAADVIDGAATAAFYEEPQACTEEQLVGDGSIEDAQQIVLLSGDAAGAGTSSSDLPLAVVPNAVCTTAAVVTDDDAAAPYTETETDGVWKVIRANVEAFPNGGLPSASGWSPTGVGELTTVLLVDDTTDDEIAHEQPPSIVLRGLANSRFALDASCNPSEDGLVDCRSKDRNDDYLPSTYRLPHTHPLPGAASGLLPAWPIEVNAPACDAAALFASPDEVEDVPILSQHVRKAANFGERMDVDERYDDDDGTNDASEAMELEDTGDERYDSSRFLDSDIALLSEAFARLHLGPDPHKGPTTVVTTGNHRNMPVAEVSVIRRSGATAEEVRAAPQPRTHTRRAAAPTTTTTRQLSGAWSESQRRLLLRSRVAARQARGNARPRRRATVLRARCEKKRKPASLLIVLPALLLANWRSRRWRRSTQETWNHGLFRIGRDCAVLSY